MSESTQFSNHDNVPDRNSSHSELGGGHYPRRTEVSLLIGAFEQLPAQVQRSVRERFAEILEAVRGGSPIGLFLEGPLTEIAMGGLVGRDPEAIIRVAHHLVKSGVASHLPSRECLVAFSELLSTFSGLQSDERLGRFRDDLLTAGEARAEIFKVIDAVLNGPITELAGTLFCRTIDALREQNLSHERLIVELKGIVQSIKQIERANLPPDLHLQLVRLPERFFISNTDSEQLIAVGTLAALAGQLTKLGTNYEAQKAVLRAVQELGTLGPRGLAFVPEITEIAERARDVDYMRALQQMLEFQAAHTSFSGTIGTLLLFKAAARYPELTQFPKAAVAFLNSTPPPSLSDTEQFSRRLGATVAALALTKARTEEDARQSIILLAASLGENANEATLLLRTAGIGEEAEAYRRGQVRVYSPLERYYLKDAESLAAGRGDAEEFGKEAGSDNISDYVQMLGSSAVTISGGPTHRNRAKREESPENSQNRRQFEAILIPPAQDLLTLFDELVDGYLGFGTQLFEAKRFFDGEHSALVNFGTNHGSLKFINSIDNETFPGRGVVITDLESRILFAHDNTSAEDPLHRYKAAWPTLSLALDHVGQFEYVFTRGFIAITCRETQQNRLSAAGNESMALIIFNSHFGNPKGRVAFLVPTRTLAAALSGSLIDSDNFVGFSRDLPDPHRAVREPDDFKRLPGGDLTLDIGDPAIILAGISGSQHADWQRYNRRLVEHFENTKTFDQWFMAKSGLMSLAPGSVSSTEERRNLRSVMEKRGIYRDGVRSDISHATEHQLHLDADALIREAQRLMRTAQKPDPLSDEVVSGTRFLLSGLQLMRIHQANWHRGYTGERDSDALEPPQFVEPEEPRDNDTDDGDPDIVLNRNAARRLFEAHHHHTQRTRGITDRSKFPILVISDTQRWSDAPGTEVYLDTWDMRLQIDGKTVQLGTESIELDDILFWNSVVLPRAADEPGKMRDLSFRARASLGIP